jgi:hypothetical protein
MRRLALLVACLGIAVLALSTAAAAVPPQSSVVHVEDDFTIPAGPGTCSFAIQGHFSATIRETAFFDWEGNLVRLITVFPRARVTFSANGKTISTVTPGVEHVTFNPDGSATLTITGLSGHLVTGGGPPQAVDVGRVVFFFTDPADQDPDLIFQAGQFNDGPFPQLCDVLAP